MTGIEFRPEAMLAHTAWLRALARELCRDADAAEDLAQDTLVAAISGPGPRRAGPRAWLAAIARNLAAGRVRAERRRRQRERRAARDEAEPGADDTVARFALHRKVVDAVMRLDEPYRTTVLLRFWEDLSARAIAERQGVPVETVRTRLKRGLAQLRARLDATQGERRAWAVPLSGMSGWWRDSGSGASTTLAVGGALVSTKIKIGAIAAVLLVGLWIGFDPFADSARPSPDAGGAAAPVAAGPIERPDGTATAEPRREAVEAPAPQAGTGAVRPPRLTVTGRLVDEETGDAIAGGALRLVDTTNGERPDPDEPRARSAPDGTFRLTDDRAGSALADELSVTSPARAVLRVHVDASDAHRGGAAKVDLGDVLVPAGTGVRGRVEDAWGRGVRGAILLVPTVAVTLSGAQDSILFRTRALGRTDDRGEFTLAERLAPEIEHRFLIALCDAGLGWTEPELTRKRRELTGVVVQLRPTGALEVVVTDEHGAPAPGVTVRAEPRFAPLGTNRDGVRMLLGTRPDVLALFETRTDASGRALLPRLPLGEDRRSSPSDSPGGRYGVVVTAEGYATQRPIAVSLDPDRSTTLEVKLDPGRELRLEGVVRSAAGVPIEGASVVVLGTRRREAETDASGRYAIPQVTVGPTGARVVVRAEGFVEHRARIDPDERRERVLDVELRRALELTGRVVDSNGDPVAGASVFCRRELVAETAADGTFEIAPFPDGEHEVVIAHHVSDAGRFGEQAPKTFRAADSPVRIVIRTYPVAGLIVDLVDASSGEPLEARDLSLFRVDESDIIRGFSHAERSLGRLTANNLRCGTWRLSVATPTGHRGVHEFTIPPGVAEHRERVALVRPGAVEGRIDASGLPDGTALGELRVSVGCDSDRRREFTQYAYLGRWRLGEGQRREGPAPDSHAAGTLVLDPALDPTFRLDSADATEPLTFRVEGMGVAGSVKLQLAPGGTRRAVVRLAPTGR